MKDELPHFCAKWPCDICALEETLQSYKARAEACAKDAERYRWLRGDNSPRGDAFDAVLDHDDAGLPVVITHQLREGGVTTRYLSGMNLDAAIDAARKERT